MNKDVCETEEDRSGEKEIQNLEGFVLSNALMDRIFEEYKAQSQQRKDCQLGLRRELRIVDLKQDKEAEDRRQDAEEPGGK